MRISTLLPSMLIAPIAALDLDERQTSSLNTTALLDLPPCLLQCATQLLPKFNCSSAECFCDTNGPLKDAMTACISSVCVSIEDELDGIRLQAQVCGLKAHTDAPPIENVAYGLFAVVVVFVVARMLYRSPQLNGVGYGWDDWCLLMCFPAATGMTVTVHYTVKYGSGTDLWLLSADQLQSFFIWAYAGEPIYPIVTCLTKVSLVHLYLRIWSADSLQSGSRFRVVCRGTWGVLVTTMVVFVLTSIFACSPIEGAWNLHTGKDVKCINRTAQGYSLGAISIVLDFVVLLLPVPRLLKLNINLGEKIGVLTTFMLGFLVTICSIVRMFYIYQTANVTNITYAYSFVGLWSLVEVYCTMICCCVPAAAGLVRRYWRAIAKNLWSAVTNLGTSSKHTETAVDMEMMCMGEKESTPPAYEMDVGDDGFKGAGSGHAIRPLRSLQQESLRRPEEQRMSPHHFAHHQKHNPGTEIPIEEDQRAGPQASQPAHTFTIFPPPRSTASMREASPSPEFWFYDRNGAATPPGHRPFSPATPIAAGSSKLGDLSPEQRAGRR